MGSRSSRKSSREGRRSSATTGNDLAKALEGGPYVLAPLKLHYLRWVLFDNDTRFMYQGIFDTDFDKYTEDAIVLFGKAGVNTVFENLEGFPDGLENQP